MRSLPRLRKAAFRGFVLLVVAALAALVARVFVVQSGPPLSRWHSFVPQEPKAAEIDGLDWQGYLAAESRAFDSVRDEVTRKLEATEPVLLNRYCEDSPIYPGHFPQDYNRSTILEPAGAPVGAAVLLHGLTDSPYSLRHLARLYRDHGFVAIIIRMPGHGLVPGALSNVAWEDWLAATRLAVREARRQVPAPKPLHIVGFSNGGALALKYALDAIGDAQLPRADHLVLISPMIGVTRLASFAGFAGWPAVFPPFARAAWLSVVPEFNPFKYNSFPVNGARQSSRLVRALQEEMSRSVRSSQIEQMPPVLTFQSVMDSTVSTPAILSGLYDRLPANGSELVLFDVNRTVTFGALLRRSADTALTRLLPPRRRAFRVSVITNGEGSGEVERAIEAGASEVAQRELRLAYPPGVYSLSHVALPFPVSDGLYGLEPEAADSFGVQLGVLTPRGERNVLIASLDSLLRVASNPFFPYMTERVSAIITHPGEAVSPAAQAAAGARQDERNELPSPWSFEELRKLVDGRGSDAQYAAP